LSVDVDRSQRLGELSTRIERLIAEPEAVRSALARFIAPVMRALEWEPVVETAELQALLERYQVSEAEARRRDLPDLSVLRKRAVDELENNVESVERAQVVYGRIPPAYAGWLERQWQIVERSTSVGSAREASWNVRWLGQVAAHDWQPPLMARGAGAAVHVGSIDPLIRAAEAELQDLGRRRRLLEAARELLLDAGAALRLEPQAIALRQQHIGRSIAQLDRYQAAGLRPGLGLFHQLRQGAERNDAQRLHAALSALDDFALARGDRELGTLVKTAFDQIWRGDERLGGDNQALSLERSGVDTFDPLVHQALKKGFERALDGLPALRERVAAGEEQKVVLDAVDEYLSHDGVPIILRAALAVDGCFDVGGVLSPLRVQEVERSRREVMHPTPHLMLTQARGPADLPQAVIDDPRSILLSLASGRLLTRRYVADEVTRRDRVVLRGEVRIYVLDGSGSMLGPRARMRDAILVAELSTLLTRLADPLRRTRPVLYYRYFNHELEPTSRVDDRESALAAISEALSRVRVGGTNIEAALLASFEQVAAARREDPELARAQIVLVTDGEAPVDISKLARARDAVGELPIGVSIIALGQENPALRDLAAYQRGRGERVFYQYIGDQELQAYVEGRGFGIPLHPPAGRSPEALVASVAELVDEIEAHGRRLEARGSGDESALGGLTEAGLSVAELSDGERAHFEARSRDERTLSRRVERWFGAPPAALDQDALFEPPPEDQADLELVGTLLGSLVDVVDLVGSDALGRQADAIEVFERLLLDSGMPSSRYQELRQRYPEALFHALRALHEVLAGPPIAATGRPAPR
jgi:hypothetical protein